MRFVRQQQGDLLEPDMLYVFVPEESITLVLRPRLLDKLPWVTRSSPELCLISSAPTGSVRKSPPDMAYALQVPVGYMVGKKVLRVKDNLKGFKTPF